MHRTCQGCIESERYLKAMGPDTTGKYVTMVPFDPDADYG